MNTKCLRTPWTAKARSHSSVILDADGNLVADCHPRLVRILSASPELLEACKLAQVRIFMLEGYSEFYKTLGRTITKVEGGNV